MKSQTKALHPAEKYARDVVDGIIPASKYIKLACKRHLDDLERNDPTIYFDRPAAERTLRFFSFLRHSKGEWAGTQFILEPWQQFIIWVLFGWKRSTDGMRRFRTAYIEVPRKNGKSTLAAGIGLYLFFGDGEPGAEVYTAATKRDQARIVHGEAVRMVRSSVGLKSHIAIFKDNLNVPKTNSKFEPLGADEDSMDGLNVHGVIIDELHAHKTRKTWEVLDTATGARRQPMLFAITTAGFSRESICWEQHAYGAKILEGVLPDDTFFCYIAGLDAEDSWDDPLAWQKCNPNFGISVKPDDLQRKCDKAKETPASQNSFRRLHLDEWTEQHTRWIDMEQWDSCHGLGAIDPITINALTVRSEWLEMLRGRRCLGGLDLASTIDIAALLLLFPPTDDDELWRLLPFFWVPEENMRKRAEKDRVPYDLWADQEFIRSTEGNVIDYDAIKQDILRLFTEYDIREIAFDRWNATQLTTQLEGEGLLMVPFGQGFQSMAAPTREATGQISGKQIAHGANPVLRWMASNVAVRQDPAGNMKPDKEKSSERIDGIVAWMMALGRAIVQPEDQNPYADRGLLTV